jgi:hypothetical protein
MIARLIETLRVLASPAPTSDVAGDFADAFLLVSDCPQIRLTQEQIESLSSLDALLERASNGGNLDVAKRAEVRAAALHALKTLEHA